jgi:hypothetical protein
MLDTGHNFYARLQNTNNYLLVKDDVGKPKPVTRPLPSTDFSYGIKVKKDSEDARAVISSWAVTSHRSNKVLDQDFRRLNILSLGEKLVTAPQQRAFRKTAFNRRMSSEEPKRPSDKHEVIYGMPLRPSTPIKAVLENFYAHVAEEQTHCAYSVKQRPPHRRNLSSQHETKREKLMENEKGLFKLKKFLNVKPKTNTRRPQSVTR